MRGLLLLTCLVLSPSLVFADPAAVLDGPVGGWRHSGIVDRDAEARLQERRQPHRGGRRGRNRRRAFHGVRRTHEHRPLLHMKEECSSCAHNPRKKMLSR